MKRSFIVIILMAFTIFYGLFFPIVGNATTPPPRTVGFVVNNPPEDLVIEIITASEGEYRMWTQQRLWEKSFIFDIDNIVGWEGTLNDAYEEIQFRISSSRYGDFEIVVPIRTRQLATASYLNLRTLSASDTPPLWRLVVIILIWFVAMVVVEGLLFYAFGYRAKKSWIVFGINNAILQGLFVCSWVLMHGSYTAPFSFHFITLILGVVIVTVVRTLKTLVELLVFCIGLKEHNRGRGVGYVLTVNTCAFIPILILALTVPVPITGF